MADFTQMFLQGLQAGQSQKDAMLRHEKETEDRDLQRKMLKHQMDRLKLTDQLEARRMAVEEAKIPQLGATPPPLQIPDMLGRGTMPAPAELPPAMERTVPLPGVEGMAPASSLTLPTIQRQEKSALDAFNQQRQIIEATRAPQRPAQQNEASLAAAAAGGDPAKALGLLRQLRAPQAGSGVDKIAEAAAALLFRKTGKMPPMGYGAAASAARTRVLNRAVTLTPEEIGDLEAGGLDIAGNSMDFAADKGSLTTLQRTRDAVTAFEKTALRNIDIFLETTKNAMDTGSPLLNQPVRSVAGTLFGSKNLAAFNAARTVALTESAKVLSNPNLSGVLSDSARKEVESLLSPNATVGQAYAVFNLLKNEMKGRTGYLDETIAEIKGRGKTGASAAPAPITATNAQGVKIISYDGGQTWKQQ